MIDSTQKYGPYFRDLTIRILGFCKSDLDRFESIHISARPFLPEALQINVEHGELQFTYYSPLRAGFGHMPKPSIIAAYIDSL